MNEAKIIKFKFNHAHFSFEKRCGYNLPLPQMIAQFFQYMHGIGPDAFVIKRYTLTGGQTYPINGEEILRGCVPTEAYNRREIRQAQLSLEAELDGQAGTAFKEIRGLPSRIHEHRNGNNCTVFVKCKDGIMGCGWFDSARTIKKGLKMAGFMLYTIGILNGTEDEVLLTAVFNYLPFEGQLSNIEANEAYDTIVRVLTPEVIATNGKGSKRFEFVN